MAAKPIKPTDIEDHKLSIIPDKVIETWNDLIAKNYLNGEAIIIQNDIVQAIIAATACTLPVKRHKLKKIIHINLHILKANRNNGTRKPVIAVKNYKSTIYAHKVAIAGPSKVVYSPDKPLHGGATCWIETQAKVFFYGPIVVHKNFRKAKRMSAKSKFKMGPLQKAWVKALCSGKYKKSKQFLCRVGKDNQPIAYCCLGVACEILEQKGLVFQKIIKETHFRGEDISCVYYDPVYYESGTPKACSTSQLPSAAIDRLKIKSKSGVLPDGVLTKNLCMEFNYARSLVELNDTKDWSLERIGKIISKYPELFFNEAA